jgi:GWxTD domain-containing protein
MKRFLILLLVVSFLGTALISATSEKELLKKLPPHHRDWLEKEVVYLITPVEREVFLKLETDREREVFISAFWKQRDPNVNFPENTFKKEHYRRLEYANKWFGRESPSPGWRTDMGRIYITLGEPKTTEKFINETEICPTEIWFYQGMAAYGLPDSFNIVFFKEDAVGEFILYTPVRFGPHTLLRNFEGDRALSQNAYSKLMDIQPKVAEVSLTLISGEPLGQPSLASEILVREKIPQAPQKKVNNLYATKFLKYRGVVEIEYADNYIDNTSQFNIFRDRSGHYFVHYLIEPSRLSFDRLENVFFTELDISGNISDKKGKTITQIKRKMPLKLNESMMQRVKDKLFSLQDIIPIIPGDYRLSLIIKNSAGMEFTSVEKDFTVAEPARPSLSSVVLGNRKINLENAAITKPFSFSGVQLLPSPRNDFVSTDDLHVFFQVYANASVLQKGFVEFTLFARDAQVWTQTKALHEYKTLPDLVETISLKNMSFAYYKLKIRLLDGDKKELVSKEEQFYITPQAQLPRPWVVSQPVASYAWILHELARQNVAAGRQSEAQKLFEEAIKMDPSNAPLTLDYCKMLLDIDAHDRVRELALPMLQKNERFEFALIMGQLSQKTGVFDEAISFYADFLTRFGAQPDVFNRIADCYMSLDLPQEALKAWKKSVEIEPRQTGIKKQIQELESKLEQKVETK